MAQKRNDIGLEGISFVEFSTNKPNEISRLFFDFGFSLVKEDSTKQIQVFKQNKITFLINSNPDSFGGQFAEEHGPSICSMGWRFADAETAYKMAVSRGAQPISRKDHDIPAIEGIGGSLIYFLDGGDIDKNLVSLGFHDMQNPVIHPSKGFLEVDHLTNNVYKGTMEQWAAFYKDIFEFTDVRYFDIKGKQTGLTSHALRSPDGSFCIPINEADEKKSQINEYLEQYNGPGIQHLAFLSQDILSSLRRMENTSVQMLDIDSDYYKTAFQRVPGLREDKNEIEKYRVLVDGDKEGYLLQIFTKNLIGPIFIEIIQRENNLSFGEGNFQALFNSIERDQEQRGVFGDRGTNGKQGDAKQVELKFPGSEMLRAQFPTSFKTMEKVADDWVNDGKFEELSVIKHPLAKKFIQRGLQTAKEAEKNMIPVVEKVVLQAATCGVKFQSWLQQLKEKKSKNEVKKNKDS